jgi:cytidylate kinase
MARYTYGLVDSMEHLSSSRGICVALPKTIALDGPAGAGKSSICSVVARELGYLFVDTGAFYRAVTLAAIQTNLIEADDAALIELAGHLNLDIVPNQVNDGREYTILLDGHDATWAIRQPAVDSHVSRVAAIGGVRDVLNKRYRELAQRGNVIMAGRDIGTVVLPDADLKIYLDASDEARAERRYQQRLAAGQEANYEDILAAMRARDQYDSQRQIAPMRRASDAIYLLTDKFAVEEAIAQVKQIILNWQPATSGERA